ncbi:MAG: YbjN domain-containing protein [Rhodospirillales bacterium]|jgi:hypothetical protein
MSSEFFHPLDLVEEIFAANDWPFERALADELVAEVAGRWADYSLMFAWREDVNMLQFACACDLRVGVERRSALYEMLALVNDQLPLGHFIVDPSSNLLVFRHASLTRGQAAPTIEQFEDMMELALGECDRFYPAFQYMLWGGKSASDAVAAAMLEPVGRA